MKVFGIILLIAVIAAGTACCLYFKSEKPEILDADPLAAELILKNLTGALKLHSAQNGGGGKSKFANDLSLIRGLYANKIQGALPGPEQTSYYGYIVRLEEYPAGDNFATNFRLIAYPAKGYRGKTFRMDKTEVLETVNERN